MIDNAEQMAEYCVCGEILNGGQRTMERIPDYLRPDDFGESACRAVFTAALALRDEGRSLTVLTIQAKTEELRMYVTNESLVNLKTYGVSPSEWDRTLRMVHESGLRRKLNTAFTRINLDSVMSLDQILSLAELEIENVRSQMEGVPLFKSASEHAYSEPKWLLKPYFQLGKGTLIQADPGVGKTALMCAVAACVSTGTPLLGLPVEHPGKVLILSTEDDPGVLRGRLEANGADLEMVKLMENPHNLNFQSPEIRRALEILRPKLVIFDPLQAFMGADVDMFRANETRPILAGLFDLCARYDCACALIAHLGKSTAGKSAVNQSLGSVDIPGIMRSILHVVRHPAQEQLMAVHIKSSNAARGKTIAYSIGKRGSVNWLELTDDTLDDLAAVKKAETVDSYESNVMVPVLKYMEANNHINLFWSYEEVRKVCLEQLSYVPFNNSRELSNAYLTPEFLQEFEKREHIQVKLGERFNNKRGLRILPLPNVGGNPDGPLAKPSQEEYEELMGFLDQQADWGMQS